MKVVWSQPARDQVVQAFGAIAAERPEAARCWFEDVLRKTGAPESFPDMGRMVPEVGRSSIREVLVVPYRLMQVSLESDLRAEEVVSATAGEPGRLTLSTPGS